MQFTIYVDGINPQTARRGGLGLARASPDIHEEMLL